jgi:hypothetical protein
VLLEGPPGARGQRAPRVRGVHPRGSARAQDGRRRHAPGRHPRRRSSPPTRNGRGSRITPARSASPSGWRGFPV